MGRGLRRRTAVYRPTSCGVWQQWHPFAQPITVAPTTRANDRKKCELDTATNECKANTSTAVGGMMVAFGTGRNVARNDPESTNVHTLYSVLDNTRYRYKKE